MSCWKGEAATFHGQGNPENRGSFPRQDGKGQFKFTFREALSSMVFEMKLRGPSKNDNYKSTLDFHHC